MKSALVKGYGVLTKISIIGCGQNWGFGSCKWLVLRKEQIRFVCVSFCVCFGRQKLCVQLVYFLDFHLFCFSLKFFFGSYYLETKELEKVVKFEFEFG